MPSLFPELFSWSFFVPTIFRIVLGAYLLAYGVRLFRERAAAATNANESSAYRIFGFLLIVLAGFFFAGYLVQAIAAVAVSLGILALWFHEKHSPDAPQTRAFYIYAIVMAFSLIFLGPGAFAVDIPL
jgi:uncharacterized membrane protein YphA (DoxX/SURF4 family)